MIEESTYYFKQAGKVMNEYYANEGQLNAVIGTRKYRQSL